MKLLKIKWLAKYNPIQPKLCGNCAIPHDFRTGKLGEIPRAIFSGEINAIADILFK